MGLNPSNRLDAGLKGFPTLGDPPFSMEGAETAQTELRSAGFPRGSETMTLQEHEVLKPDSEAGKMARMGIHIPGAMKQSDREWVVLSDVEAKLGGWKFRRAWYYWVARTESGTYAIPVADAEKLNEEFRQEVRVDGCAGGQNVREPVKSYHVDTPRGLDALVKLLERRYEEIRAEQMKRYE